MTGKEILSAAVLFFAIGLHVHRVVKELLRLKKEESR